MRKIFLLFLLLPAMAFSQQSIVIADTVAVPDASIALDIRSKTKGFLPPRLSLPERNTLGYLLGTSQTGMQVADAQTGELFIWTGIAWSSTMLTAVSPLSINTVTNEIALNAGTTVGDLLSWDGYNWVSTQPATQHFKHEVTNMQPYLAVNYFISLYGIYPSQSDAQPYIGQILISGFNFAPVGYMRCDGSLLPIAENDALFTLIGTTYGGDGQTTFALPDLRGRTPVHFGAGPGLSYYTLGQLSGSENSTISY